MTGKGWTKFFGRHRKYSCMQCWWKFRIETDYSCHTYPQSF
ncbi:unnamed protein product [Tenebrio molitor]|nr:unnamed protein product [Tenebrio molitor]